MFWEVRDEKRSKSFKKVPEESIDEKINRIINSIGISRDKKRILKNKIITFLNAKDCTTLSADVGYDGGSFIFLRQNQYVQTVNEFLYYPGLNESNRIFHDCYSTHFHDGLLEDLRFKNLIESTGLEFNGCGGGYVLKYSGRYDEFLMKDEIDVKVKFKVDSSIRLYHLDLDEMKLSDEFFEYEL